MVRQSTSQARLTDCTQLDKQLAALDAQIAFGQGDDPLQDIEELLDCAAWLFPVNADNHTQPEA